MGMFNFVLDSFKGEIFDFKVKRQSLIAGTVLFVLNYSNTEQFELFGPTLLPGHVY